MGVCQPSSAVFIFHKPFRAHFKWLLIYVRGQAFPTSPSTAQVTAATVSQYECTSKNLIFYRNYMENGIKSSAKGNKFYRSSLYNEITFFLFFILLLNI